MAEARDLQLMRSKIKLLSFMFKNYPLGYEGSISELARKLGYADDSYVNRMLHELLETGFVGEKNSRKGHVYKVTLFGEMKILPFLLPDVLLLPAMGLGLFDLILGMASALGGFPVNPGLLIGAGAVCTIFTLLMIMAKNLAQKGLLTK